MGRKKKFLFENPKMFSGRVEESDYIKFEFILKNRDGKSLQDAINAFVRSYISGNVYFSGDKLFGKDGDDE